MALDNSAIRQNAGAAISGIGVTAYLVKGGGQGDAANPFASAEASTETVIPIQVIYTQWRTQELREAGLIRQGDRKVLVSVPSLDGQVPEIGDGFRETPDGPTYRLVDPLTALAPNGEPLLYTLNIRS